MFLPPPIIDVFSMFQSGFTQPTYQKRVRLAVGTVLARGRRTVASALRHVGLHQTSNWATYHHVLNRATWSSLRVSHILLNLILATFCDRGGGITIAIDETLERRWGRKLTKRGHWRDSRQSRRQLNITTSGLRWVIVEVTSCAMLALHWCSDIPPP